jgi:hypothetical protein
MTPRSSISVVFLPATVLHQLGLDHNRLTFRFQGLDQKLTGTNPAHVVRGLIA